MNISKGKSTLLIRIKNVRKYTLEHRKMSKLSLIGKTQFYKTFGGLDFINGISFGYFVALMLISIILYLSDKETIYLQTSILILFCSMYSFSADGYFFKIVHPNFPSWSMLGENIFGMVFVLTTVWVGSIYLEAKSFAPKLMPIYYLIMAINLVLIIPALHSIHFYNAYVVSATIAVFFTFYVSLLSASKRIAHSYYFAIGFFTMVLLFIASFVVKYFDLVDYQIAIQHYNVQVATIFYITCLVLGIIDRFIKIRKDQGRARLENERAINRAETEKRQLIEKQNVKLEKKVAERTKEIAEKNLQLEKLDQMKSRFFANISHEFRTPLTLIIGPAKRQLMEVVQDSKTKLELETILASADQLLDLINQLLDLAKSENEKIELELEHVNSTDFINQQIRPFLSLAETKNIHFLLNEVDEFDIVMDEGKMKRVFDNLVFNALKFSPEESEISIKVYRKETFAHIEIIDQGPGIPDAFQEKVFDRFYQLNSSDTSQGSGIGLALAKVYVTLHGGSIHVEKNIPIGSKFIVQIPDAVFLKSTQKNGQVSTESNGVMTSLIQEVDLDLSEKVDDSKTNILIVEDEERLRQYIASCFDDTYQIYEAANGTQGLRIAQTVLPEMVISDVMMPKMDGITMTKHLKSNIITSHIPILLLTAKASIENKVYGLNMGADDYLTKPFDSEELIARVQSIVSNRRKVRDKYSKAVMDHDLPQLPVIEQKFIHLVEGAGLATKNWTNS